MTQHSFHSIHLSNHTKKVTLFNTYIQIHIAKLNEFTTNNTHVPWFNNVPISQDSQFSQWENWKNRSVMQQKNGNGNASKNIKSVVYFTCCWFSRCVLSLASMHCLVSRKALRCAFSRGQCVNMPAKLVQNNAMVVQHTFKIIINNCGCLFNFSFYFLFCVCNCMEY